MFDKDKILTRVQILSDARDIPYDAAETEVEADRAIEYGAFCRNCTVEELQKETKDYTNTLISMVMSALQLYDKLGRITTSENGVMNTFENGDVYQKQDIRIFTPLGRGAR